MNPLERMRLLQAFNINGFHNELGQTGEWLLASATFAPGQCAVAFDRSADNAFFVASSLQQVAIALTAEKFLGSAVAPPHGFAAAFSAFGDAGLHLLIRRVHQLSVSLPSIPWEEFQSRTSSFPQTTEIERLTVQRIGQDIFRAALVEYWGGECAVSGIDQTELLRASHVKPWAACSENPEQRLDVCNGLLLVADVDAAFDAGLISFADDGSCLLSHSLTPSAHARFSSSRILKRERVSEGHRAFLDWHRKHVFHEQ